VYTVAPFEKSLLPALLQKYFIYKYSLDMIAALEQLIAA
jgi:hypothetical protein